jgi:hypothetical protein
MTLTLSFPPDDERKLARLAKASGTDTAEFVRRLVKKEIDAPISITEAAEPFARAVEASGVSDEEFTSILEEARTESRQARRGANRKSQSK